MLDIKANDVKAKATEIVSNMRSDLAKKNLPDAVAIAVEKSIQRAVIQHEDQWWIDNASRIILPFGKHIIRKTKEAFTLAIVRSMCFQTVVCTDIMIKLKSVNPEHGEHYALFGFYYWDETLDQFESVCDEEEKRESLDNSIIIG